MLQVEFETRIGTKGFRNVIETKTKKAIDQGGQQLITLS